MQRDPLPVVLSIAGSDSGGGAGIQADLKTFFALNVHGTAAVTCTTAQNPRRITEVQPVRPRHLRHQMDAVFSELPPLACKTGLLFSSSLIRTVAETFENRRCPCLIIDPVMIATSGATLLSSRARETLLDRLLPLATLITPNLDEAAALTGLRLRQPEDLRKAARQLADRFGCAVLVKGGHLRGLDEAVDLYFDGRTELLLSAPFVRGVSTHGTGCTYSAAIAAFCARGKSMSDAVRLAKVYVTGAIAHSRRIGKHWILNWNWQQPNSAS
ncbi:MAG TPA: bifunctional hydroxymethylpyrimidine kinase/phosphomethylpyrimidine kinase [Methylomirabilota bacterium]|nr:bifunctional hydroxymethylpyrimidine kinase/phosphomethylpyrimidine kinase [Methylomirabilota bacterium]